MKLCDFVRPTQVEEARQILKELGDDGLPVAGGTALHFMGDTSPKTGVDMTRLGMSGIEQEEDGYRIGAATPLADIMEYRAQNWALHEITRRVATHQIRNISTIGGNIARVFPWCDLPVALLAMNATMLVQGETEKDLSADEYFDGQPARLFETGDILTAIKMPLLGKGMGYGSHKTVKTASGFSVMTGCAVMTLDGDTISDVRVTAGGATTLPCRIPSIEDALKGQPAEAGAFKAAVEQGVDSVHWIGREGATDDYAHHLAGVVLEDVLNRALDYAKRRKG